ncbi:unnamed protein product [Heligmosomoides polygyrus]|uniref:Envelope glycoprotein N n=1 Tax=Heligmosomoides polygyrus TaxID=6339 RepID=A0A183G7J4_HELPZ|nr:unnamed protein product [Heligmosomoides polygyrus]
MASLSQTIFTSFLLLNAAQGLLAAPEMAGQSRDGDSEENPTQSAFISYLINVLAVGFCVALTLVGMAFAGVRFWMRCRRNTSGHTVY